MTGRAAADGAGAPVALQPGERLLWQGRPERTLYLGPLNPGEMLFGLAFAGFALFWIRGALGESAGQGLGGLLFPLAGLPFLIVGLYLAGGRFLWQAWLRRHRLYALTSRRAIVVTDIPFWRRAHEWPIDPATVIEWIDAPVPTLRFRGSRADPGGVGGGFEGLRDGIRLRDLMRQVQAGQI